MDKNMFAQNPPMGWNSWDCYGAAVTEEILLKNADYMAEHLKDYGWEYVVCDIQWYEPTADSSHYHNFADICIDEYGRTVPAVNRFPSSAGGKGFLPIADYIHAKGLKFGIHIMRGIPRQAVYQNTPVKGTNYTARDVAHPASICCWNTDMYGIDATKAGAQSYYDSLLELYASWGVDFIKVDDICVKYGVAGDESSIQYGGDEIEMIHRAILRCGRPIVLSLSPGPAMVEKAEHLCKNANMWRITNDYWDEWPLLSNMFERCEQWSDYVSPGCFPDCDMLPIGHLSLVGTERGKGDRWTRFTESEQRTMMTLWSIFRSPLFIGCELTDMDDFTKRLLTNESVIGLTKRSRNARQIVRTYDFAVWEAEDAENPKLRYVALFNLTGWEDEFEIAMDTLGLFETVKAENLWTGETKELTKEIRETIPVHDCVLYRVECEA